MSSTSRRLIKNNALLLRSSSTSSRAKRMHDRNARMAMYASSAVIGALGATYASVPLYKLFCQATGFGGTTQRVILSSEEETEVLKQYDIDEEYQNPTSSNGDGSEISNKTDLSDILKRRIIRKLDTFYDTLNSLFLRTINDNKTHGGNRVANTHTNGNGNTWTDDAALSKLSNLQPHPNGRLLRIHFDTSTSDILPWTFKPTQGFVKVVPGETALCFFTATNHSPHPITGVATYNVHPPKAGLYFNKIQCFCFEEQRLLPGETVDMPVFFYVDPTFEDDVNLQRCNHITLSYTFFRTDVEDDYEELTESMAKYQEQQEEQREQQQSKSQP